MICIARALLTDPNILFLDKATAIDTFTEALIQDALSSLFKGRTAMVNSHRLGTVRKTDWIFVLDKGKIVEP